MELIRRRSFERLVWIVMMIRMMIIIIINSFELGVLVVCFELVGFFSLRL